ncbi:MAG: nucleotidyltransferase [Lentisphaerae bacterium]|nr:nucleotidyltransferase [Lentisphaerota bacterium]
MADLTLVVLAAGMGSRYGGLKQLDPMGPNGETIMDYSVFDAVRAGFNRVVFVIRRDFEAEFKERIGKKYEKLLKVDYAFQQLDDLPDGFTVPEGREKPWGTGHALLAARNILDTPFAVINADDFYGADSYKQLAGYLSNPPESGLVRGVIATFILSNTLSENGSVARGICSVDNDGYLRKVTEFTKIVKTSSGAADQTDPENPTPFTGNEQVSMNSWGFMPEFIGKLQELLIEFLKERGTELKSEFYLPGAVDTLISRNEAVISARNSRDSWFGVTYREDRPMVQESLGKLVEAGSYPSPLFDREA